MIVGVENGFSKTFDGVLFRGRGGIAHPEIDDVDSRFSLFVAQVVDFSEQVGRQFLEPFRHRNGERRRLVESVGFGSSTHDGSTIDSGFTNEGGEESIWLVFDLHPFRRSGFEFGELVVAVDVHEIDARFEKSSFDLVDRRLFHQVLTRQT